MDSVAEVQMIGHEVHDIGAISATRGRVVVDTHWAVLLKGSSQNNTAQVPSPLVLDGFGQSEFPVCETPTGNPI